VQLLAGDRNPAVQAFKEAREVGWSGNGHCANVVLPYLLLAGAGMAAPPAGTALADLWNALDSIRTWIPDDNFCRDEEDEGTIPTNAALMRSALPQPALDRSEQDQLLDVARKKILARVRTIVTNQHRNAYGRAAFVVVAFAETLVLRAEEDKATGFIEQVRSNYPRHRAFRHELDALVLRSSLLRRRR